MIESDDDDEYSDLDYDGAAERYLRLIESPKYRVEPEPERICFPRYRSPACADQIREIPSNVITSSRRVTPALRAKISSALDVCPITSVVRAYELFHLAKFVGYCYDYKLKVWILKCSRSKHVKDRAI